jgi:hypothetical protein
VALDDRHRLVDLPLGRGGEHQGLAAAGRLGVAAGVALVEAAPDDRGHDLLLGGALEHLDVLPAEPGLDELVHQGLRGLGLSIVPITVVVIWCVP